LKHMSGNASEQNNVPRSEDFQAFVISKHPCTVEYRTLTEQRLQYDFNYRQRGINSFH
jgi:hypothetical protein